MSFLKHSQLALAIFSAGISSSYAEESVSVAPLIDQPILFQAVIDEVAVASNQQFSLDGEVIPFAELKDLLRDRYPASRLTLTVDGTEQRVDSTQVFLDQNTLNLSAIQTSLSKAVGSYVLQVDFEIQGSQLSITLDQQRTQLGDEFMLQLDDDWQAQAHSLAGHLNGRPIPLSELMVI